MIIENPDACFPGGALPPVVLAAGLVGVGVDGFMDSGNPIQGLCLAINKVRETGFGLSRHAFYKIGDTPTADSLADITTADQVNPIHTTVVILKECLPLVVGILENTDLDREDLDPETCIITELSISFTTGGNVASLFSLLAGSMGLTRAVYDAGGSAYNEIMELKENWASLIMTMSGTIGSTMHRYEQAWKSVEVYPGFYRYNAANTAFVNYGGIIYGANHKAQDHVNSWIYGDLTKDCALRTVVSGWTVNPNYQNVQDPRVLDMILASDVVAPITGQTGGVTSGSSDPGCSAWFGLLIQYERAGGPITGTPIAPIPFSGSHIASPCLHELWEDATGTEYVGAAGTQQGGVPFGTPPNVTFFGWIDSLALTSHAGAAGPVGWPNSWKGPTGTGPPTTVSWTIESKLLNGDNTKFVVNSDQASGSIMFPDLADSREQINTLNVTGSRVFSCTVSGMYDALNTRNRLGRSFRIKLTSPYMEKWCCDGCGTWRRYGYTPW